MISSRESFSPSLSWTNTHSTSNGRIDFTPFVDKKSLQIDFDFADSLAIRNQKPTNSARRGPLLRLIFAPSLHSLK